MTMETIVVTLLLAVLGGGCLLLTLLTLPGNWLILLLAGVAQAWSMSGDGTPLYSGWTLVALFLLAILGEVAETGMPPGSQAPVSVVCDSAAVHATSLPSKNTGMIAVWSGL